VKYDTAEGTITITDDAVILTFEGPNTQEEKRRESPRRLPFSAMTAATLVKPKADSDPYLRFWMKGSGPNKDPYWDPNTARLALGSTYANAQGYIDIIKQRMAGRDAAKFHRDVRLKSDAHATGQSRWPYLAAAAAAVGILGLLGYGIANWFGDDESPTDTYAFDATYVPTEMGSATPEARFIDDAVSLGFTHNGGATEFPRLALSICNDIKVGHLDDREASEIVADEIGTTLEKAHMLVLSAQYNFCR
jgi:hypothetical protein